MIRSSIEIKAWLSKTPSVCAARPRVCVGCGTASCPVGERLRVHGQGLVQRQLRGPLSVDGPPELVTFLARKYECQSCGAVMTVVPSGVLAGRQYTASAISAALWLFVVTALSGVAVRTRISPWRPALRSRRRGWAQVGRWANDVRSLFGLPRPIVGSDRDDVVRRTLVVLMATAPPGLVTGSDVARLFAAASSLR